MNVRVFWLVSVCLVVGVVAGCPPAQVELEREMTGFFSEQDRPARAVLHWVTDRPDEPFFNVDNGWDWRVDLVDETGVLARVDGPAAQSGAFAYQAIYWNETRDVLVGHAHGDVWLRAPGEEQWRTVRPPASLLNAFFGPDGEQVGTPLDVSLSPDGQTVGAFFVHAYVGPDGPFDLRFDHAVFFWSVDGTPGRAHHLAWPDDRVDPHLRSPAPVPFQWRMLWTQDSDGVWVVDRETALLVPVAEEDDVVEVADVPARAVNTNTGPVSSVGEYFVAPPDSPNEGTATVRTVDGWVAFEELATVPLSMVDYAVPRPD